MRNVRETSDAKLEFIHKAWHRARAYAIAILSGVDNNIVYGD